MSPKSSTTASSSELSADDMEPVPANTQVVINTELIQGLVASGLLDRTAFSTAFAANVSKNVAAGSSNVAANGESAGTAIASNTTGNSADNAVDLSHSDSDSESVSDVLHDRFLGPGAATTVLSLALGGRNNRSRRHPI